MKLGDKTCVPGQGITAYIFPGVGLGVIVSRSRVVTDVMFLAAAHARANMVTISDLERGRVYPPLSDIRQVSAHIAADVAKMAYDNGFTDKPEPEDVLAEVQAYMYRPIYPHYV